VPAQNRRYFSWEDKNHYVVDLVNNILVFLRGKIMLLT